MEQFEEYIEKIKQANPIDVIVELEYPLGSARGHYRRASQHDSLVVDLRAQAYHWNSNNEHGDVVTWLMRRKNTDFKGAVEWLARRANMEPPKWGEGDPAQRMAARRRQDAFTAAAGVYHRWLLGNDQALAYAHGRGWTDETIQRCMLGFTGLPEQRKDLISALQRELLAAGVDLQSPEAVALTGMTGDVRKWAAQNNITAHDSWVEWIPGMVASNALVYPHIRGGLVRYFATRGIAEKKHYNLPEVLVGKRQPYLNAEWSPTAEACVLVEGQADAVTLGQWGIPAVALAGTSCDEDLVKSLQNVKSLYVGLDDDQAGAKSYLKIAEQLGPLTRLIRWPAGEHFGEIKDANDLLKAMVKKNMPESDQRKVAANLLRQAPTYVEELAAAAGLKLGAERDEAQRKTVETIAKLGNIELAQYETRLARALNITVRELRNMIKALQPNSQITSASTEIIEEPTVGGYIQEHMIELLYDPETVSTRFAVRYPDGHIEEREDLVIGKVKYTPIFPNAIMQKNVVLFPTKVVARRSTRELVAIIRQFIHRFLDVDDFYERLSSYYVLFSWVYDAFTVLPYLRALGDYGTGKTRLIQTIGSICYRPIFTGGATTTSPIFRMLDAYRGTLVLDEADLSRSDESADIIKILNTGYMKGMAVLRSIDAGSGKYDVQPFSVFGPKVIATRKKFGDQATESRCLTKEMGGGVPRGDVPIVLPREFNTQATEIRNLLLAYRLATWKPEIEVDYNSADRAIEARLNQVTLSLKTIVEGDEQMISEIDGFIREYNRQLVVERSMTIEAKVLEAIVKIQRGDPNKPTMFGMQPDFSLKHIAKVANDLIETENADEDDDDDGKRKNKLTPKGVGVYLRTRLNLNTERHKDGFYLIWNEERVEALKHRFGVV